MGKSIKLFSCLATLAVICSAKFNSDAFKTMEEIAADNGFMTESYTVTTSDGYALSLYRIPGTFTDYTTKKPVVLLMHA